MQKYRKSVKNAESPQMWILCPVEVHHKKSNATEQITKYLIWYVCDWILGVSVCWLRLNVNNMIFVVTSCWPQNETEKNSIENVPKNRIALPIFDLVLGFRFKHALNNNSKINERIRMAIDDDNSIDGFYKWENKIFCNHSYLSHVIRIHLD